MQDPLEAYLDSLAAFTAGTIDKVTSVLDNYLLLTDEQLQYYTNKAASKISFPNTKLEAAADNASSKVAGVIDGYLLLTDAQLQYYIDKAVGDAADKAAEVDAIAAEAEVRAKTEADRLYEEAKKAAAAVSPTLSVTLSTAPLEMMAQYDKTLKTLADAQEKQGGFWSNIGDSLSVFSTLGKMSRLIFDEPELLSELGALPKGEATTQGEEAAHMLVEAGSTIGAVVGAPLGFLPIVMDCYSAGLGESVHNLARAIHHPSRMAAAELALAFVRGNIVEDKLLHDGNQLGFTNEDIAEYVKLTRYMLSVNDLITLWLRKEITDSFLDQRMLQLGVTKDDTAKLKSLAYFIPGVQDLIRMAVREAFTPEIAEKFGQYEDYPEAVTKWGEKQGLTKEWMQRYWASHWELPGASMGFEMFQRKIISHEDLVMLLRALDVMPYWRDKIIQLSYIPLGRIDIRRMHKLGILKDEDLTYRYELIGYSPEDAISQATFTMELNKEEVKLEKQAERDLTASEVTSAYANVLIDEDSARALLAELNYSEPEIDLKLALAELPAIKRNKTKLVEIIRQRLLYNAIDLNGAVDELNKLDLPPYELEYQLLDFQQDLELAELKKGVKSAK